MVSLILTFLSLVGCSEKDTQNLSGRPLALSPAYAIIYVNDIENTAGYREYTDNHLPQMAQYGGRFLAESSSPVSIEGELPHGQFILLQKWLDSDSFKKWYNSGEYILLKKNQRRVMRVDIGLLNSTSLSPELAEINSERAAPKAVYAIMEIKKIKDQPSFDKYMSGRLESIKKFGGSFLAQQKSIKPIEGMFPPTQYCIMIQWPDIATFNEWYDSESYKPWRQLLHTAADYNLFLLNSADLRPELIW